MQGNACSSNLTSSHSLSLNIWYHIAFSFGGNYGGLLINGVVAEITNLFQTCSNIDPAYSPSLYIPNSVGRQNNYFGTFPPPANATMYAEIDLMTFYSGSGLFFSSEENQKSNKKKAQNKSKQLMLLLSNKMLL